MSKVIIASSKTNSAVKIENFTGSTFADLKADAIFASVYGDGKDVDVVIKPGNVTIRSNDSLLPATDFNVFIIPSKNKAGHDGDDDEAILDSIEELKERLDTIITLLSHSAGIDPELAEALRQLQAGV